MIESATNIFDAPVEMRRTSRLQKLYDGPYGDVLEGRVRAREETVQVSVHAAVGLIPDVIEGGVIISGRTPICTKYVSLRTLRIGDRTNQPFEDRLPRAAALLPCTSELGEFVRGINTSHIPISSN